MVKNCQFLTVFLFLMFNLQAQTDSLKAADISQFVYQYDTSRLLISINRFKMDSIEIIAHTYSDKIETENYFTKSKTNLKIIFFLKDTKLVLTNIVEQSPKYRDLQRRFTYYFENEKIIHYNIRYGWPLGLTTRVGDDPTTMFGYNETFTDKFLREYIGQLFNKL